MTVMARDDVTLALVTDVASTSHYFQLRASTASAPTVPTVYPAPSPWVTTEPAYTEGATNSLYTVDVTVFSDGSFDYTPVSLSSSYEAAKAAYNKAQQAQSTAVSAAQSATSAQSAATAAQTTTDNLSDRLATTNSNVDNINSTLSDEIARRQAYMRFSQEADGDPALELGASSSPNKVVLTNDRLSFKSNDAEVAYVGNDQMNINNANVTRTLRIGNFMFAPRADGHLTLTRI